MDTFCEEALNTEILGIKAESWRYFLQIQTDSVTVNDIKKKLASKFGITDFSDSDRKDYDAPLERCGVCPPVPAGGSDRSKEGAAGAAAYHGREPPPPPP